MTDSEQLRNQKLVEELRSIRITRGVVVQMARHGQILQVRCEMPECYCPRGRAKFVKKEHPPADWQLTADHYPLLRSEGGTLTPDNVRLAHTVCNRINYGWRKRIGPMLKDGMSLATIADELNRQRVQPPHGTNTWTARMVRKAAVS